MNTSNRRKSKSRRRSPSRRKSRRISPSPRKSRRRLPSRRKSRARSPTRRMKGYYRKSRTSMSEIYAPRQRIELKSVTAERVRDDLINQFPILPIEIIYNAVEEAQSRYYSISGVTNIVDHPFAYTIFMETALKSIESQKRKMRDIMEMIMLVREKTTPCRHESGNNFGHSLLELPSRPLEMISDILQNAFEPVNNSHPTPQIMRGFAWS